MSIWSSIKEAVSGPLAMPKIDSLGSPSNSLPAPVGHEAIQFNGWDDPRLLDFFRQGRMSGAGVAINQRNGIQNSAIFRSASLISCAIGMLPITLLKRVTVQHDQTDPATGEVETLTTEGAEKAKDHYAYKLIAKKPNKFMTPYEFWSYMAWCAIFHGMAYAYINRKIDRKAKGGFRYELIPLDPRTVQPKMSKDWKLFFRHDHDGRITDIPMEEMFWFRSPQSNDGVTGIKLLDVAAEAIGLAKVSEQGATSVLTKGSLVGGVLEHPKSLDEKAIARLRSQMEERHSGPENRGKWIVAEDGMKANQFAGRQGDPHGVTDRRMRFNAGRCGTVMIPRH